MRQQQTEHIGLPRDGYHLHFIDTDTDTAYRYRHLSILL